jgi:hypothetical protein
LTDRYVRPFKIFKFINFNAYELELSKIYKRLYRIFPVSLLEPYSRKKGEKSFKSIDLDKKDRFQVKSIRKKGDLKENLQFLIK